MDPLRIYDYLAKARAHVLNTVRTLTPEQYNRPFAYGLKSLSSTLTHIMISEWYYVERLEGRHVEPYDMWPIKYETPPAFDVVDTTWRTQSPRVRAAIAAERDWTRAITYQTQLVPETGKRYEVTATAGDMVTQLALHEVHHRAQIMAMLRQMGDGVKPLEDLDFNDFMFQRRELA